MRFTACALTAVLLSGCSWLGTGGGYGDSSGYGYNGVYSGCSQGNAGANFANAGYGYAGGGAGGCAPGAGYNVANSGGMYGAGAGAGMNGAGGPGGLRGAYGVNGYGTGLQGAGAGAYGAGAGAYGGGAGMYAPGGAYGAGQGFGGAGNGFGGAAGVAGLGAGMAGYGAGYGGNGVTTLGSAAPYGSAVGGVQGYGAQSYQGGNVQTVQGAPIYVPQPYPAYYQAQQASYGGGFGGGALPFGLELGGGQEYFVDGDIFPGELGKPFNGGPGVVSDLAPISYSDAYDAAQSVDMTATYDINRNTTLLGRVGYSKADGNAVHVGTVSDGLGTVEDLYAEFSDLEQYTVEGGFRHYMGQPNRMRPYIGGTAGFVKTEDVTLTQGSASLVDPTIFQQTYVDGGWSPTASGLIGAEMAVGNRSALGVETGIRWKDSLDTNFPSDSTWSVPVKLRGRVSF